MKKLKPREYALHTRVQKEFTETPLCKAIIEAWEWQKKRAEKILTENIFKTKARGKQGVVVYIDDCVSAEGRGSSFCTCTTTSDYPVSFSGWSIMGNGATKIYRPKMDRFRDMIERGRTDFDRRVAAFRAGYCR